MGPNAAVTKSRSAVAASGNAPFLPAPPAWASRLVDDGVVVVTEHQSVQRGPDYTLVSLGHAAENIDGDALEALVEQSYRTLRAILQSESAKHPLRIWNFVPGILSPAGAGLDRYMRFNAGRYREFLDWFGGEASLGACAPAASAVGHQGRDFVLHALCSHEPAKPVANPRQRAPHRYSKKFGPIPPCFARAVAVGANELIIGGTASIVDETSMHVGQLDLQLAETRANLEALVRSAFGPDRDASSCIDHLRAYHVRQEDRSAIERSLTPIYPRLKSLEFFVGDLCRGDLLVEIEGHATNLTA